MFSYVLSVAIAFIVFGTVSNIVKKVDPIWYDYGFDEVRWVVIAVASILWFITVPLCIIALIFYLLKLLTDKIADIIIKKLNDRKQTKGDLK